LTSRQPVAQELLQIAGAIVAILRQGDPARSGDRISLIRRDRRVCIAKSGANRPNAGLSGERATFC